MEVTISSADKKSVRVRCEKMVLRAQSPKDAELLAKLHQLLLVGGTALLRAFFESHGTQEDTA